jgi:hypothetical protein
MSFKEAFPVLYGIAHDKDTIIVAHLVSESGSFQWDVSFIQAAHDWEVDVLASFFMLLYSIRVGSEGETSFGGLLLTKVTLMLVLSIRSLLTKR